MLWIQVTYNSDKNIFENLTTQVTLVSIVEIDEMFSQVDLAFNPFEIKSVYSKKASNPIILSKYPLQHYL